LIIINSVSYNGEKEYKEKENNNLRKKERKGLTAPAIAGAVNPFYMASITPYITVIYLITIIITIIILNSLSSLSSSVKRSPHLQCLPFAVLPCRKRRW
jgi:hypothetical protein